tara:strand:- start:6087 stop:6773 length:687 start_codon:yes stop_codon:yes gene_type:complete
MSSVEKAAAAEDIIDLRDCQLGYAEQAILLDINLKIKAGESVAILGKSGAGKSTLVNHIFQQYIALDIALIPQDLGLVEPLSVFHNVYMGALKRHSTLKNLRNLIAPQASELTQVKSVLQEVQLDDKLTASVKSLSGGEKQRVALARALYQKSTILLADEPVSAVDSRQAEQLMLLAASRFPTIICSLHDIELAIKHCKRIIGIHNSSIVVDSCVKDLDREKLAKIYE